MSDSIEERIAAILEQKGYVFDEVIESVENTAHHFTTKELMKILELATGDIVRARHGTEGQDHGKDH